MFILKIRTDNAAFDNPEAEITRILKEYIACVEADGLPEHKMLLDANGNCVGAADYETEEDDSEDIDN